MKLLFISPVNWNFYKYRDQELPINLASKGHDCIYLNPVRYKNWKNGSVRLQDYDVSKVPERVTIIERKTKIEKSALSFLYETFSNVRQIIKHKPDAVICTDHLMGVMACVYCRLTGKKFIFDNTDDWSEVDKSYFSSKFWKYISKPLLRRFSYSVTSTSHDQADYFRKRNNRTFVIPNGKPLSFIKKLDIQIKANEKTKVNFIASLRDWYDFDLMFEAFSEFPEIELNIYGMGDMYEELKERAGSYENIFLRGNASSEMVSHLLNETAFGIIPLRNIKLNHSTCPIKLFDYWCAKKAVITTPMNEIKAIAEDKVLYASGKTEFVNSIAKLIDNKEIRDDFGKRGFDLIISNYNYDIISDRFLKILEQ